MQICDKLSIQQTNKFRDKKHDKNVNATAALTQPQQ